MEGPGRREEEGPPMHQWTQTQIKGEMLDCLKKSTNVNSFSMFNFFFLINFFFNILFSERCDDNKNLISSYSQAPVLFLSASLPWSVFKLDNAIALVGLVAPHFKLVH